MCGTQRACGARDRWTSSSSVTLVFLACFSEGADGLVVELLFHYSGQLFFHAVLQELDDGVQAHFLIHNSYRSFRLITGHDQSWEQYFLELLVTKVTKWQVA